MKLCLFVLIVALCGWSAEIIPTAKKLNVTGERVFPQSAVVLVNRLGEDKIPLAVLQSNLREMGCADLLVSSDLPEKGAAIIIGSDHPVPERVEGYSLVTEEKSDLMQIHLSGYDRNGIIYAAVTLSHLLSLQADNLSLPVVHCEDYPDVIGRFVGSLEYHFRKVFMYRTGKGCEEAKRHIDWLVNHKINIVSGPNCQLSLAEYITPEAKRWLREVNDYARARGLSVFYYDHFNVGRSDLDKGKPELAECVELRGLLFDWGFDELLVRKMTALNEFLVETGYNALFLHTIDTTNSRWPDRGPTTTARFGDSRLDADANAINIFYREFKAAIPDGKLFIVPRPYNGNLHYPDKILAAGELNPDDDLSRFTRSIPQDIHLCKRESDPVIHQSWYDVYRQPLLTYIEGQWGRIQFSGAPLSTTFIYCRGLFKPDRKDYFYYASGWPQHRITALGGIEYSWNLDTPGGKDYRQAPSSDVSDEENVLRIEQIQAEWDPFGPDGQRSPELAEFIKKACRVLFGPQYGPLFYSTGLGFIRPNLVFDTRMITDQLANLNIPVDQDIVADWLQRVANDCQKAVADLEIAAAAAEAPPLARYFANNCLNQYFQTGLAASVLSLAIQAETAAKANQAQEARRLIGEARTQYDRRMAAFPAFWQQQCARESFYKLSGDGIDQLRKIGSILHLKEVVVAGRLEQKITSKKKIIAQGSLPELVTIGLYNPPEGLFFGATGLQELLSGVGDFRMDVVTDLRMSTLKKYSAIVFPDCKRFGKPSPKVEELREYVFDYGGGIYFEHDSCGFKRFPLQAGIFPEIGELKLLAGKSLRDQNYNPEERQLRIRSNKRIFRQCYFDHFLFQDCQSEHIWVEDLAGQPVWLAAPLGNGRVVYNGGITYADNDEEISVSAISEAERDLIIKAVRWASGKTGHQLRILNISKREEVQTDAIRDVISFNLYINPAAPIQNAQLSAQCYRSSDWQTLPTVARLTLPDSITEEWESEQPISVATTPQSGIILVLTLTDQHGKVNWEFQVK